jgi:hypothetical protein
LQSPAKASSFAQDEKKMFRQINDPAYVGQAALELTATPQLDFLKNGSGLDVMISIFCDFCQISAKNWCFSQKLML